MCSIVLCVTVLYYIVLYIIIYNYIVYNYMLLHCIVLHCTMYKYIVINVIVLHCIVINVLLYVLCCISLCYTSLYCAWLYYVQPNTLIPYNLYIWLYASLLYAIDWRMIELCAMCIYVWSCINVVYNVFMYLCCVQYINKLCVIRLCTTMLCAMYLRRIGCVQYN